MGDEHENLFSEEEIVVIRQMITTWRGFSAIGAIMAVVRELFWFVGLAIAFYLAATGHIEFLSSIIPKLGTN